jgi:hypothetical protein
MFSEKKTHCFYPSYDVEKMIFRKNHLLAPWKVRKTCIREIDLLPLFGISLLFQLHPHVLPLILKTKKMHKLQKVMLEHEQIAHQQERMNAAMTDRCSNQKFSELIRKISRI